MPKRNVKVEIPLSSPNKMISMNELIIERHEELGDDSPLKEMDMDDVKNKVQQAKELRRQAQKKHAEAEALNQKARVILGIDVGQDSSTEGTIYYLDTRIRNLLLFKYPGGEEELSTFGMNVVISMSKLPKRKKKENSEEKKNEGEQPTAKEPPGD